MQATGKSMWQYKNNEIAAHHLRKHKLAAHSRACGLMQRNTKLGRILRHWIIGKYESREEVYQSFYIYVSFLLERERE